MKFRGSYWAPGRALSQASELTKDLNVADEMERLTQGGVAEAFRREILASDIVNHVDLM